MRIRTTRGIASELVTSISRAQSSGIPLRPISRAAAAGNSAWMSSVPVKKMLTMSSGETPLRASSSRRSFCVPATTSSRVSSVSAMAPRTAYTRCMVRSVYVAQEFEDLGALQLSPAALLEAAEPDGTDGRPDETEHDQSLRREETPDEAVSAFADGELEDRLAARRLSDPDALGVRTSVLEAHALLESVR